MKAFVLGALLVVAALPLAQAGADPPQVRIGEVTYATLHDALAAARAGDVITVAGGVHDGPFEIRESVQLLGTQRPLLLGSGAGTVVTIRAQNVTLAGFLIQGSGSRHDTGDAGVAILAPNVTLRDNHLRENLFGLWVAEAAHARIEGNTILGDPAYDEARRGDGIRLWYSPHAIVRNNTIDGARDLIGWYARNLTLEDNTIRHARYGIHLMYCSDASILRNDISQSSVGIYTMTSSRVRIEENGIRGSRGPSGYGLAFKGVDDADVTRNVLADNVAAIYLDTTPFSPDASAMFRGNVMATNDVGVLLLPAVARTRFEENTFWDNLEHVSIHGGHASGANTWRGNHWSGFAGYDSDGDGYSEVPYRAERFFESLQAADSRLRVLAHSPLADALEAAATTFPIVRPEPKLEDPRPRTSPHALPFTPTLAPTPVPASSPATPLLLAAGILGAMHLAISTPTRRLPMPTPAPTGPALRITNLTTGYGKVRVLAGVQLDVLPGEAVALWGENGAGKTTLLKAVLGLLPHEGRVEILGADTKREPRAARGRIGYVPQEIQLEDARVGDVMRTYAALRGARRADAYGLLQRLGLGPHEHKRTSELSGGLRQRLGLALALLNNPAVLLLDEPTANLDAAARAEYIERLRELTRQGKAILFTSHRTDEVAALASRVAVLGSARQITLHTQRFLDANPEVITA